MNTFSLRQINAIKEKVKSIGNLEKDIKKYVEDRKHEYKEASCVPLSYLIHQFF